MTPVAEKLYKKARSTSGPIFAMQEKLKTGNDSWKFKCNSDYDALPYFATTVKFFHEMMHANKKKGYVSRVVQVVTATIDPDMESPIVFKTEESF